MGSPTLKPDDVVARYRVVGPLGSGGMGEVYLARDPSLERNVALKVLPPEMVRDEERVRRFELEAKSASSLSHPNIVTIYEIGRDPVPFISMELIQGKTLATLIHDDRTDLRTLLGFLAQAAEGVAKAHAAGIVHRDLKPGNIMVSSDGFAKVLDFGLAKLTEHAAAVPDLDPTSAPTRAEVTGGGLVVGTAGYMSPEQVRGLPVDGRSDVFSFGCVLYEAVTRTRPFAADSVVETMHRILHDKPAPIEERNPACPSELRRLIRRCMAKSPDQRVQSMKDLALEIREIVEEWDSLSVSPSSGSGARPVDGRRRLPVPALVAAVLLLAGGIAFAVWAARRGSAPAPSAPPEIKTSTQTNRGDVTEAAISSDGRYLAYLAGEVGRTSVRVRQVATGSDLEVVPFEEGLFEGLSFSPDGNYLFYRKRRRDTPRYSALMQVASLGGPSREVAFDVDSRATFSPDGKEVAFKRGFPEEKRTALVLRDLATGRERELANIEGVARDMPGAPAWSPDGMRIAVLDSSGSGGAFVATLALFEVENGRRIDLQVANGAFHESLAWLSDGSGLVRAGYDFGLSVSRQISIVDYPAGTTRRVTRDGNDYFQVSVSTGDEAIAAVRQSLRAGLWLVDPTGGDPRPVTLFSSGDSSPLGVELCNDGSIVFTAARDDTVRVWSVAAAGGEPRPLTEPAILSVNPRCFPGGILYDRYDAAGTVRVWRMDADGGHAREAVPGMPAQVAAVARNGSLATFRRSDDRTLWVLPLAGGPPRKFQDVDRGGGISPDGNWIVIPDIEPRPGGLTGLRFEVWRSDGSGEKRTVALPERALVSTWSADSASMLFLDPDDPAWNVARVSLDGSPPKRLTTFAEGRSSTLAASPDGTRLAIARKIGEISNVWLTRADGSQPVQVTRFHGEEILGMRWSHDGKQLLVSAGQRSSDAVLIRSFR